ncbi:MAG: PP0621 family protein [Nitrosomonas sp.]|nr:PP0621 family protein [Nitrosomonas sp.]
MKWIVLIALGVLAFWVVRQMRRIQQKDDRHSPVIEDMVCCAHCGVHLPRSESVAIQDKYFCSALHLEQYQQSEADGDK